MSTAFRCYQFIKVNIARFIVHRGSFWLGFFGQWLAFGTTFATTYLTIMRFGTVADWKPNEILMLYAFNLLSYSIASTFLYHPCFSLADKVRSGEYDIVLTKPMHPLLYEICNNLNFGYISHFTMSVAVLAYCFRVSHITITLQKALYIIVYLISGSMIQAALLIIAASFSFILGKENRMIFIFFRVRNFTDYPITIYNGAIQVLLTVALPFAYVNFYPIGVILEKGNETFFPDVFRYMSPLVGILLILLSVFIFNNMLKKYSSTGS